MAKFTYILIGAGLTGIIAITVNTIRDSSLFVTGSQVNTGNVFMVATPDNPNPKIVIAQNDDLATAIEFQSGSTDVKFKGRQIASGALVTISGQLTLTEVNYYASGALSIPNPVNYPLLCRSFVIDTNTSSGTIARVDVAAGTGAVGTMGLNQTGSLQIANNLVLNAYKTFTASGSGIIDAAGNPKFFKLYPTSDRSKPNTINIVSDVQSGALLNGRYHTECYLSD